MAAEEKSANQFISALVKNLQAVCHGHVEFDQNVKVVGHLFLTVDSNTEFNYILNEKVSKSDESSTTFVSKSFYATDPQQKTPKKNPERPLPSPTPNVLGKTRFDISVDLTDDQPQGGTGGRFQQMGQQRGQFAHPRGGFQMNRNPQMRRRAFDQRVSSQMAKMPRLSSPMRHPMNMPSGTARRMPTAVPQRLPAPSSATSPSISSETRTDITSPSSIPPESVSGTPAQSLPGADKPETEQGKEGEKNTADSDKDVKFEVIKVENGSVVASDKDSGKGEAQLRIESVTSHDLSLAEIESAAEKESESKSSEASDSERPSSDPPEGAPQEAPETSSAASSASSASKSKNEPDVIEIDLTKVKDEGDNTYESDSGYMFDDSGMQQFPSGALGGDNSLSSYGGESNDEDFFASLREQTVGLYPVGLHANESNNQNFQAPDIPNLGGSPGASYLPVGVAGTSSQSNQPSFSSSTQTPIASTISKRGVKRKANNNHYSPELRAEIGKYAVEFGNTKAARKYSKQLNVDLGESSVRAMKKRYLDECRSTKAEVTMLEPKKRGRPLLLSFIDEQVANHVKHIRRSGGVVSQNIVIATAKGIVKKENKSLLFENGGSIDIGRSWAISFLKRLGFVQHKGTELAPILPPDFQQLKENFLRIVKEKIAEHKIPAELIISFGETGLKIVPVSNWTMAQEGMKQIDVKGEVTALLGSSADGSLLPPQLLYMGKTSQCHAKIHFPEDWSVSHSKDLCSTEKSMLEYINTVLVPYFDRIKEQCDFKPAQRSMVICDMLAAFKCESVMKAFKSACVDLVFVPAGCRSELLPIDLSVNVDLKAGMKQEFTDWYSDCIAKDDTARIEMNLFTMKPLHARWFMKVFDDYRVKSDLILQGWKKTGLLDCL